MQRPSFAGGGWDKQGASGGTDAAGQRSLCDREDNVFNFLELGSYDFRFEKVLRLFVDYWFATSFLDSILYMHSFGALDSTQPFPG